VGGSVGGGGGRRRLSFFCESLPCFEDLEWVGRSRDLIGLPWMVRTDDSLISNQIAVVGFAC